MVNNIMKEAFPDIVDERFTANMESLLDSVEEGTVDWKIIIRNFYPDLGCGSQGSRDRAGES